MARIKKTEGEAEADNADLEALLTTGESLNPALETIKAELGITGDADVTAHVSKLDADGNGNEANVWRGDPDSYDLEQIAKKFGSGQYRIMVYMRIPSGQKVRKINKVIGWLLSADDESKRKSGLAGAPNVTSNDQSATLAFMREMMAEVRAGNERMIAALTAKSGDPLAEMGKIASIVKTLMPVASSGDGGLSGTLGMARSLITLVKEMSPAPVAPEGTGPGDYAMMRGLDLLGKVFEKSVDQQKAALPAPNEIPEKSEDAQTDGLSDEEKEQLDMLKIYLKQANRSAKNGMDPVQFAEDAYDMLPDEYFVNLSQNPEWFNAMVKFVPDCANYKDWYLKVREKLIAMAIDDEILTPDGQLRSVPEDGAANKGNVGGPPGTPA